MADYWAQAQLDPSYIAQHGGLSNQLKQLILNYGSSGALSTDEATNYQINPGDISGADTNPYSIQANLRQQLSGDQYGITNNANAHGALYSGAHAAMQAHELQNAGQRNYSALQTLQGQIGGIDQQNTNALTGAYGTLAQSALNDPTIPAAPISPSAPGVAPPAVAAPPPVNGLGTPWVDPGARENLVQPPPAPLPKVVAAKQIVGAANRGFIGHA